MNLKLGTLEFFQGHQRLRIISGVLALLAWIYIRFVSVVVSPHIGESRVTIPVTITGLRQGASAHLDPQEVTVLATGILQSDLSIRAIVDLGERSNGVYYVPVSVEAPDTILSLSPANVKVTIKEES